MYTLKGFVQIPGLVNNEPGMTAPIGELSSKGYTYAREKTSHAHQDFSGVALTSFWSKENEIEVVPQAADVYAALQIGHWVYTQANAGLINGQGSGFNTLFHNTHGGVYELLRYGALVPFASGKFCPEYIEFSIIDREENSIKLWFSSSAFLGQYDGFETIVLPPIEPVINFFGNYNTIKTQLDAITLSTIMERVERATAGHPYTRVRIDRFEWVNPNNPEIKISTDWATVLYGVSGDNLDTIKEQIIEYLVANSDRNKDEWGVLFPEIFRSTEYVMVPMWEHFSIPNRTLATGMFSPAVPIKDAKRLGNAMIKGTGYTPEWLADNLVIVNTTYRSIPLVTAASPSNTDGVFRFNEKFQDYFVVASTSPEFMRMSPKTRDFILMLTDMLRIAEELTPFSSIPVGYTRVKRDDVYYLARSFDTVNYLVALRFSVIDPTLYP